MKNFIKENWFKITILIVILFCAGLIFLYETKQQNLEKQTQISNLNASCQKLASQKKDEIAKNDPDLYISSYEYKYNPAHESCILAYTGMYLGTSIAGISGHYLLEVDNLSTGEPIMHTKVDPGDYYRQANGKFDNLRDLYIGSTISTN